MELFFLCEYDFDTVLKLHPILMDGNLLGLRKRQRLTDVLILEISLIKIS